MLAWMKAARSSTAISQGPRSLPRASPCRTVPLLSSQHPQLPLACGPSQSQPRLFLSSVSTHLNSKPAEESDQTSSPRLWQDGSCLLVIQAAWPGTEVTGQWGFGAERSCGQAAAGVPSGTHHRGPSLLVPSAFLLALLPNHAPLTIN